MEHKHVLVKLIQMIQDKSSLIFTIINKMKSCHKGILRKIIDEYKTDLTSFNKKVDVIKQLI